METDVPQWDKKYEHDIEISEVNEYNELCYKGMICSRYAMHYATKNITSESCSYIQFF